MMRPDFSTELTDLYCCRYDADASKEMRREAEREAVMKLVRGLFGEDAVYSHDAQGAPLIEGCEEAISVTHGAGMAVVAVSRASSVGVDVECWREQLVRVKARYVADDDLCSSATEQERLLTLWTDKEAVYKAARTPGLALLDIHVCGDIATACGCSYRLTHFGEFPVRITVAELIPAKKGGA